MKLLTVALRAKLLRSASVPECVLPLLHEKPNFPWLLVLALVSSVGCNTSRTLRCGPGTHEQDRTCVSDTAPARLPEATDAPELDAVRPAVQACIAQEFGQLTIVRDWKRDKCKRVLVKLEKTDGVSSVRDGIPYYELSFDGVESFETECHIYKWEGAGGPSVIDSVVARPEAGQRLLFSKVTLLTKIPQASPVRHHGVAIFRKTESGWQFLPGECRRRGSDQFYYQSLDDVFLK